MRNSLADTVVIEEGEHAPGAGAEIHLQPVWRWKTHTRAKGYPKETVIPWEACTGQAPVAPWKGARTGAGLLVGFITPWGTSCFVKKCSP